MPSNYPPGVTGNERQIAGVKHYKSCPQHEDYVDMHECMDLVRSGSVVEGDSSGWQLVIKHGFGFATAVGIQFCPYCGDDLLSLDVCICREIEASRADDEADRRRDERMCR